VILVLSGILKSTAYKNELEYFCILENSLYELKQLGFDSPLILKSLTFVIVPKNKKTYKLIRTKNISLS